MNLLLIPTWLLAAMLFVAGERVGRSNRAWWPVILGAVLAVPELVFAAYYTKLFGEALWLYWFRSLPGTELSAAGIGFLAGGLQAWRGRTFWKRYVSGFFIPFLTTLVICAPYLKQIVLRPHWSQFQNRWSEDVCLQSSESSCGPASAATLLRHFGKDATELELAQAAFTTRRGTENWYLIRAIRRHGLNVRYVVTEPGLDHLQFPAIAGVRLNQADGAGHFIALLGKKGDNFVVGDPLNGREELPAKLMVERYCFTGFYLVGSP